MRAVSSIALSQVFAVEAFAVDCFTTDGLPRSGVRSAACWITPAFMADRQLNVQAL
jgi:hypothetical protein